MLRKNLKRDKKKIVKMSRELKNVTKKLKNPQAKRNTSLNKKTQRTIFVAFPIRKK